MIDGRWIFGLILVFSPVFLAEESDTECQDLTPHCTGMQDYCNRTHYFILMTEKCAKSCDRCNYTIPEAYYKPSCRDNILLNCGQYVEYCKVPRYIPLMKAHCPFTCGVCDDMSIV